MDEIGETCNLSVLDGDQLVYVDRVESSWPLQMRLSPGSHVPLHCTASGKLFLTQFSPERLETFLHRAALRPFTDRTITDPHALQRELERVRETMVGTDDAEYIAGLVAVSVPVYNRKGRMCATLAVHGPIGRMTLDSALECVPAMKRTAVSLSLAWFGPGEA